LLWAMLLAVCQMGWMLAQSFTLRAGSAAQQAAVRVLPPITAAAVALTAAMAGAALGWHGPSLVLSALLGYAVGALWLVPALRARPTPAATHHDNQTQADQRSAALRIAHTLVDALLATAILVVWQRLYGAEETGWMSALLRVLGFVPAVVHVAWAQVVLAKGLQPKRATAWWVGIGAFACVIALGLACALALDQGWLDTRWDGVWHYIAPLVLWQGSACLSAAFSYRPFQTGAAGAYSWACIVLAGVQAIALFAPIGLPLLINAYQHMATLVLFSSVGLISTTIWTGRLRSC
jgi:uncharacterized membrane protein YqaE (UPF0057 family)